MSHSRFHWCFAAGDLAGLQLAANSGGFASAMVEPVVSNVPELEAALALSGALPSLRLTIPFRCASVTAPGLTPEDLAPYFTQPNVDWSFTYARLPFAPRGPAAQGVDFPSSDAFLSKLKTIADDLERSLSLFGTTSEAAWLAIRHAACLWRLAVPPSDAYPLAVPVLHFGKRVGLVAGLVARPTSEEAAAVIGSGPAPAEWLCPGLCRIPEWPVNAPVVAGTYQTVADLILAWTRAGISEFLFAGADSPAEISHFIHGVLPLVRQRENSCPIS